MSGHFVAGGRSGSAGGSARPGRHRGRHRAGGSSGSDGGRNVPLAVAIGGGLGVVALVPLIWFRLGFVALIAVVVAVAVWELGTALRIKGVVSPSVPLLVGSVGTIGLVWFAGAEALLVGVAVTIVAALLWRLPDGPTGFARDVGAASLVVCYVPLLAGFVVLLAASDDGAVRVMVYAATTAFSDTGGLAAGVLFGRRKMAPGVSPGKTWEGFAGSMLACVACGIGFFGFGFGVQWGAALWQGALFGAAICLAAVVGDLAESLIKRDVGVKDMGSILPAHGGFLDRFDSYLMAAPVAYLILTLLVAP